MMMTSLLRASVSPRSSIGRSSEDIERTFCVHILARYQASMLRSLKEVQGDDSIVGFYQAMALGSFTNQTLVETQAIQQEKLRHGGIVVVHGASDVTLTCCAPFLTGSHRHLSYGTRKRCLPRLQADEDVPGGLQEEQFQHREVTLTPIF